MKKILLSSLLVFSSITTIFASGHVATATGTSPTCNGLCNGSATAMASGGIGPYGFTWTGPASYTGAGANITSLCAGTYTVTAIDSSDMSTALYTLNLTQPAPIVVSVSSLSTICAGELIILATSVTGGTPAYTYSWSPVSGIWNPSSGVTTASPPTTTTYTVTVTDANGCTGTAVKTITVNPIPVVSVNSPTICAGQAAVLVAGGATSYSWSSGGVSNPNTVLPATTTSYTVTGGTAGCTATAVATVTVIPAPIVTLSPAPATCGLCNGFIIVSASGATSYMWTGPSGYSSTLMNISGLCAGTYTLTATGGSGCSTTMAATVGTSSSVVATIGSVVPSGCSVCNGSATIFATGGTPPYSYSWNDPGSQTTATATSLCPGTYTAIVTDANGCSYTVFATISSTSTVTATTSATPTGCMLCNGSANVTASGGSGGYTYDWVPGTPIGDGTTSISGLCLGTYTITVTDSGGCTGTSVTTVNNTTPVVVTANAMPSTCGACNGTVTVIQSGGTGPYLYDLTGFAQQTNGNFSGVCVGIYVATVTDINGCSGIYTIMVSSTNTTSFSVGNLIQNETGYGLENGSIDLTITGSAPPYTFLWSNGATTENIYSLSGGAYIVTITDNNGDCATYTYTVSTSPSFGYITGFAYNDINANCIYDLGDNPMSGYYVFVTNGTSTYWGYTNTSGYYSIWVPAGSYIVTPGTVANLEAACTNTYSPTITAGGTSTNNNFAYAIPPVYDVCLFTWSSGVVPGFNGFYNVYLSNYGNQPATGVVYIVLPGIVNYVSSFPAASSVSGDTVFWNYTLLPAYGLMVYNVTFNTPPSTLLGTVAIAFVNASVTNGTDVNPGCNTYVYTRLVSGSFDPNAKTVSPSGSGASGNIPLTETEFSYLVQFQNTGTGVAVNINVTDTISPILDLMSFEMLNSSDDYVVEFLPGNVIRWKFDNIMLPDSTSDEAESHGHVQFRISKLNTPSYGEVIENKAFIYFDFNEPVITNIAVNTYSMATVIEGQANENGSIIVYPNPFSDNSTFVIQSDKLNEIYSFELTDVLGKKVKLKNEISEKQFEISRDGLQNGIYFYKVYTSESIVGIGKVVIK